MSASSVLCTLSSSMSVSEDADARQVLMLFSTTWLQGSRGFSFFFFFLKNKKTIAIWSQRKEDTNRVWTALEMNGRHCDINIAQLQMTV